MFVIRIIPDSFVNISEQFYKSNVYSMLVELNAYAMDLWW